MASRYITAGEVLDRVFDDEFDVPESEDSDEDREEALGYPGYLSEVVLNEQPTLQDSDGDVVDSTSDESYVVSPEDPMCSDSSVNISSSKCKCKENDVLCGI